MIADTPGRVAVLASETDHLAGELEAARAAYRAAVAELALADGYLAAAQATGLRESTIRGFVADYRHRLVADWATSVGWVVAQQGRISLHRDHTVTVAGVVMTDEHGETIRVDLLLSDDVVERCVIWDDQSAAATPPRLAPPTTAVTAADPTNDSASRR